ESRICRADRLRIEQLATELLLRSVEVAVLLVQRELGERLALVRRELLGALDTVLEPRRHRSQRELGVDVHVPRNVDGGEEDVAELLEDVRIRFRLRRR